MKKISAFLLACVLLTGCGTPSVTESAPVDYTEPMASAYESRFARETVIRLSDSGMDVTGPNSLKVFASQDLIYYEDRETYESGNPYGEGKDW